MARLDPALPRPFRYDAGTPPFLSLYRDGPVKPGQDGHDIPGIPPMMAVGLGHYLVVSAILLVLGIFGIFLNRKNIIVILMAIELMLLAVNLNLVAFSAAHNDLAGQVM